jgi:hypothetical protein
MRWFLRVSASITDDFFVLTHHYSAIDVCVRDLMITGYD